LEFKSKALPRPLTDLSAWWDYAPQAYSRLSNINFDIWICFEGGLKITHKKISKDDKVLFHLEFKSKVLPRPLTDLSAWVGLCTSSP